MKIYHITNDIAEASGVGTFVRRVHGELVSLGVDSHVLTEVPDTLEDAVLPDIVHIHGMWLGVHRAAIRWAKLTGCKVVWSTHGMTAPWSMRHKWWKKAPAWLLYQWRDLLSADLVHSTTDQEAEWNRRWFLNRQCVIPLGTNLPTGRGACPYAPVIDSSTNDALVCDFGQPSAARQPKAALGDRPLPCTLLYVGRIYPVKALDNAIRALALVKKTFEAKKSAVHLHPSPSPSAPFPLTLRIVGPDQAGHMAELMSLCDSLHLTYTKPGEENSAVHLSPSPLVQFIGPKFGSDLAAEYENCDCAILASHTENFGATIVDAMAHGKPVIAGTKTPWRIVAEVGCGWWVDNSPESLANTFSQLLTLSPSHLQSMGANGFALVKQSYTWSAVGRALLAEYEKLLKGEFA